MTPTPDDFDIWSVHPDTLDGFCGLTFEAVQSLNGDSAEDADEAE
jgi:hypothetical protein